MIAKGRKTLGALIKDLREANGLTLREVERRTKISNSYLSQVENGQIKRPSPNFLHKMSEVLNYPYESLMERAGYVAPKKQNAKKSPTKHSDEKTKAFAIFSSIQDLTEREAEMLVEFLNWRRSRQRNPNDE